MPEFERSRFVLDWWDESFNAWIGCTEVSVRDGAGALMPSGCDNCYARAQAMKYRMVEAWGRDAPRRRTKDANWQRIRKLNLATAGARTLPGWRGRPRVFGNSMNDVFDNYVSKDWHRDLWALVRETPNLFWMLLTHRPKAAPRLLPEDWGDGWHNVALGVTVESPWSVGRLHAFFEIPAKHRFFSIEPLLGDIAPELPRRGEPLPDLAIFGYESGVERRAPDQGYAWMRNGLRWAQEVGVAGYVKQIDKVTPIPDELMVRQWPEQFR